MDECKKLRVEHTAFVEALSHEKREEFRNLTEIDRTIRLEFICFLDFWRYYHDINPINCFQYQNLNDYNKLVNLSFRKVNIQ